MNNYLIPTDEWDAIRFHIKLKDFKRMNKESDLANKTVIKLI